MNKTLNVILMLVVSSTFLAAEEMGKDEKPAEWIDGMDKFSKRHEGKEEKAPGQPLVGMPGLREDSVCLTGNATGERAARNQRVAGRYTYSDGRTDWVYFPHFSPYLEPGRVTNVDEFPNRAGGWVAFDQGKLTDGEPQTKIAWPPYLPTSVGLDLVFDLGAECAIDSIEGDLIEKHLRNLEVILKSDGEERWTTVQSLCDRATHIRGHYPKIAEVPAMPVGGMSARHVRLRFVIKTQGGPLGFSEIRIWGRPLKSGDKRVAKKPLLQLGGRMEIAQPREIPTALPDPAVLPFPQQYEKGKGEFVLSPSTRIVLLPGTSERTKRTAEILASDLKEEAGLDLKVVAEEKLTAGSIIFHPLDPRPPTLRPQSYSLTITPERVEIRGDDEQGVFYATQTLLQMAKPKSATEYALPAATIRDWSERPMRMVATLLPVTPELIKTLARFKITHYGLGREGVSEAVKSNRAAEDRFVQFLPLAEFNSAWEAKPQEWAERPADEPFEKLNPGRINPCPSHPDMWASYFALIDKAAECYGEHININTDEMYETHRGARWNVCPRCRARNLSGHELMADAIEKINTYVKRKGKKLMMSNSVFYGVGISHPDDKSNDWRKVADILEKKNLNKEILVGVWQGEVIAARLNQHGFPLVMTIETSPKEPLPDFARGFFLDMTDSRVREAEILASLTSAWSPKRAGSDRWTGSGSDEANVLVEHATPLFAKLFWKGGHLRAGSEFFSIDLRKAANRTFTDDVAGDGKGWADLGPNYDLRALKPGKREFAGVPFEILDSAVMVHNRWAYNRELPERIEIPVGRPAASVNFLHTIDSNMGVAYWVVKELCGYYFVIYEDGTYEPIELKNGINITKFDGLSDFWDAGARGNALSAARLAWRGQTGSGNEAVLYRLEWVNPFPKKKIDRILFASPKQGTSANPILVAATGVVPTSADEASAPKPRYEFGPRRVELLYPPVPVGRKIDLANGREEDEGRVWRTNGITLELTDKPRNSKSLDLTQPPWMTVGNIIYENGQNCGMVSATESSMRVTLSQPRKLAGIRLCGQYRDFIGQQVNRPPNIYQYNVSVLQSGETVHTVSRDAHIPDEEGPLWLALDGRAVNELRIQQTRNKPGIVATELGIDFIELYEDGK